MVDWIHEISELTSSIDRGIDIIRGEIAAVLGIEDPVRILPYRGYGSSQSLLVKGRVLKDEGIQLREEEAPFWKNLCNMYRRFATDEVPRARLQVRLADSTQEILTNDEGFFELELPLEEASMRDDFWHGVEVSLLDPDPGEEAIIENVEIMIVGEKAEYGVISDIDDTIVHTAATDLMKMIRIVYLGNAESRRPFDGVNEFYQSLHKGHHQQGINPIFYVSSSAWNMYDVFARFMDLNGIPKGPILLRDIELSLENLLSFDHVKHKLEKIKPIFERFPNLPFILIGDSGQKDAAIYRALARQYPGRILGVLIRDVLPRDHQRQQEMEKLAADIESQGSQFFTFQDTREAMAFAAHQGWIERELIAQ